MKKWNWDMICHDFWVRRYQGRNSTFDLGLVEVKKPQDSRHTVNAPRYSIELLI